MSTAFFSLGLFQLENLLLNNLHFVLIDLERNRQLNPQLSALWSRRTIFDDDPVNSISAAYPDRQTPLIILCSDGRRSAEVATELAARGFEQLFIVAGGMIGLSDSLATRGE